VVLVAEVQQGAHYLLEAKVAVTCDTFEGAVKEDAKVIETDGYCAWRAKSKNDL